VVALVAGHAVLVAACAIRVQKGLAFVVTAFQVVPIVENALVDAP